jgi:hypothetical protein
MKYIKPSEVNRSDILAATAYKTPADEIVFETTPSVQGCTFLDHLILLYGAPKIGKSTLFSKFPGVYFLPTEPGFKALKVRKTEIPNWQTFRKFIEWAEKHPSAIADVKLWCIDTVTNLSKFCMQWVCGREGISHPSDQEWGKGWEAYADEFAFWILRLAHLRKGIGFIAHSNTTEIVSRHVKITKNIPDIPKTCYRLINNLADVIVEMNYVDKGENLEKLGEMRCLFTKPSEIRDAGDRTGRLPEVIEFKTESVAVMKILRCFRDEAK